MRRIADVVAAGLVCTALLRWRWASAGTFAGTVGIFALISVIAFVAPALLKSQIVAASPMLAQSGRHRDDRITSMLRRYEVVVIMLAAIVLVTRMSGGSFRGEPTTAASDLTPPSVTPFAPQSAATTDTGAASAFVPPASPLGIGTNAEFYAGAPASPAQSSPGASAASSPALAFEDDGDLGDSRVLSRVPSPGTPTGVAVGPAGDVWVSADAAPKIFHFAPDGGLKDVFAVPGAQAGITALVLGRNGILYVASRSPAAVLAFDIASGTATPYATIPNPSVPCAPPAVTSDCDGSVVDQPPLLSALAFDARANLFVADSGQGAIWRVPAGGGPPKEWTVQPSWTNPTRPAGPTGIAVDGAGKLIIAVRSMLSQDVGGIFVQEVGADGSPGALTQLATTDAASRPGAVALATSGRIYVSLSGGGRVLVLGADGKELARTPAPARPPIDTPVGLAFRGQSLLVAVQAPSQPSGGQIVRLPVGQTGGILYSP
jgi:sugar lactone lactonase YvrE